VVGTDFKDMRVMCAGGGSAGLGVCNQLLEGLVAAGLSREEARTRFVVCTSEGALGKPGAGGKVTKHAVGSTAEWVNDTVPDGATLLETMKAFKPTVLLGLSAQGGIFTEELIREMGALNERPIILPMSNPTTKAECSPEQAYLWTEGRAVVATGSPFPSTVVDGKTYTPSQCNNMYIFPGLGLAASVAGVSRITDKMLYRAAVACAESLSAEEVESGRTFPDVKRIRDVSCAVACAVIDEALKEGLTTKISPDILEKPDGLATLVRRKMYYPDYVPLV
jgi:malic enzyme